LEKYREAVSLQTITKQFWGMGLMSDIAI